VIVLARSFVDAAAGLAAERPCAAIWLRRARRGRRPPEVTVPVEA